MLDSEQTVLIIEDNPGDAHLLESFLDVSGAEMFQICKARTLEAGLERIARGGVDLVLLDLGLPDSVGLETFTWLRNEAPHLPVVVLTGLEDEEVALEAVSLGAQDYLPKSELSGSLLVRSILYALERHRLFAQLEAALGDVERLQGMLPVCGGCLDRRDDDAYWQLVHAYLMDHKGDGVLAGSLCPACEEELAAEDPQP